MTELVLVRHGETAWHSDRYAGRSDVPLTPRGREQAAELARWAAGAGLDAVLTSPLRRAHDTASAAAEAAGLAVRVDERLVEVDFGKADGHTRAETSAEYPDAVAAFLRRPASAPMPGGLLGADAVGRAAPVLTEAAAAHPEGRVLVVAHQTLLRLLLCSMLGLPLDHYRAVFPRLENTARTVVRPAAEGPARCCGSTTRRPGLLSARAEAACHAGVVTVVGPADARARPGAALERARPDVVVSSEYGPATWRALAWSRRHGGGWW